MDLSADVWTISSSAQIIFSFELALCHCYNNNCNNYYYKILILNAGHVCQERRKKEKKRKKKESRNLVFSVDVQKISEI